MEPEEAHRILHWLDPEILDLTLKLSQKSFARGIVPPQQQLSRRNLSDVSTVASAADFASPAQQQHQPRQQQHSSMPPAQSDLNPRTVLPPLIPSGMEGDFGTRSGEIVSNQSHHSGAHRYQQPQQQRFH